MSNVTTKTVDDITIVCPAGGFVGGDETTELTTVLHKAFKGGSRKAIVDFKDTDYVNSWGLGQVVGVHRHYAENGGRLCLCNANDRVTATVTITKVISYVDVYATEEEAIASFKD